MLFCFNNQFVTFLRLLSSKDPFTALGSFYEEYHKYLTDVSYKSAKECDCVQEHTSKYKNTLEKYNNTI